MITVTLIGPDNVRSIVKIGGRLVSHTHVRRFSYFPHRGLHAEV
jgi:hypothetical protein